MKDLLEYIKLSDKKNWELLYPMIRDAYGQHICKRIPLTATENYLISMDLHHIRDRLGQGKQRIPCQLISSRFLRERFTTDGIVDDEGLVAFINTPKNDFLFDILFVIKIIEAEDRRESYYRKIPLYSAIFTAVVTLTVGLLNIYFVKNVSNAVKDSKPAVVRPLKP